MSCSLRCLGLVGLCISLGVISSAVDINVRKCSDSSITSSEQIFLSPVFFSPGSGNPQDTPDLTIAGEAGHCKTKLRPEVIDKFLNKSKIKFLPDGKLFVHKEYFLPEQYCVKSDNQETLVISVCEVECGITHTCVKKCCGFGKVFDIENLACVPTNKLWSPAIYSKTKYNESKKPLGTSLPNHFLYKPANGLPGCLPYTYKPIYNIYNQSEAEAYPFRLLDNGKVAINTGDLNSQKWITNEYHCVDGMLQDHGGEFIYSGDESDQILFTCEDEAAEEAKEQSSRSRTFVYLTLLVIAITFLILTTIVYLILWEKHNIHGWTVFSFVVSMLVFFGVLIAAYILSEVLTHESSDSAVCKFMGIIQHFTFLCTMCWMSVINVDLWLTFRSLEPSRGRTKSLQRYGMYFAFAVGVPTIIVILGIILDATYSHPQHIVPGIPNYGRGFCRVHPSSEGWFIYLPMGILLGSNILMFSSTVFTLWRYRQTTQNATNSCSGTSGGNTKQSFWLFLKLFIVMGITWVTEFISWACDEHIDPSNWFISLMFDVVNLLQSVAIFFIFAAKRENLLAIYRKYPGTKKLIGPIMRWKLCRVDTYAMEQTEMTSADKNRIDRNTRMTFTSERMSNTSMDEQKF